MAFEMTRIFKSQGIFRWDFFRLLSSKVNQIQPSKAGDDSDSLGEGNEKGDECLPKAVKVEEEIKKPEDGKYTPRIVIIGAGMAGLTAASILFKYGFTNIKILEAKEKPGGRIMTTQFGNGIVELGCPFITGASLSNPIYTLAATGKIIKDPIETIKEDEGLYFTSDGRALPKTLVNDAREIYEKIIEKSKEICHWKTSPKQKSLSGFIDDAFTVELNQIREIDRYDIARLVYGMLNQLRIRLGDDLTSIGLRGFGCRASLVGPPAIIPQGMDSLVESLVKEIPEESLLLCKRVKLVRWGNASQEGPRAIVKCYDGSELEADYVLVTFSLGVLKNYSDEIFCPALPSSKMAAIKNIGYGNMNRLFLRYQQPFWTKRKLAIHLSWSPEEVSERSGWVNGIASIREAPGSKDVLVVEVGGPEARLMEHAVDIEIIEEITCLLRKFLDDQCIPLPIEALSSQWKIDPLFNGAFSYMGPESNQRDIDELASPLPLSPGDNSPPILLFAGEHTHPSQFGTLQGARRSGFREASRLINFAYYYKFMRSSSDSYRKISAYN